MATREDGKLIIVTGKSRSGKSAWTKKQLNALAARIGREIVFDIKGEYANGYRVVDSLSELGALLQSTPGPLRVAYRPISPKKDFGLWAKMAFTWCKMSPCVIVAEELADVTTPAKAPDGWGQVCRQSLGFGGWVFAITQRPSESDKTAIGNASLIHCCKMARADDRRYMAKELDVPVTAIDELIADESTGTFTYIERNMNTNELFEGRLTFD